MSGSLLASVYMEGVFRELIFERRPKGLKRVSHGMHSSIGNSRCKGLEIRLTLMYIRNKVFESSWNVMSEESEYERREEKRIWGKGGSFQV